MHESTNVATPDAPTAGPWGMVPIWVLDPGQYLPAVDPATLKEGDDKPLNGTDMRVYVALRSFADPEGLCWPTTRTVAERANVGKSTAEKAIGKLRRIGLLTSEVRHRGDGSISGCLYRLRNDPPATLATPSNPEGGTLESEGGVPQDPRVGTSESDGGVPADPMGGTPESGGAGTNQGTHQGNTPSELPKETPPSSLPREQQPPSPPASSGSRSRRGEKGRRKKSLDEQARDEGLRQLTVLRDYQPAEAAYLLDQLTRRHGIYSPEWWRTAHGNGTLDDRIAEVIADYQAGAAPPAPSGRRHKPGSGPYQNQPDQVYIDWVGQTPDLTAEAAA